MLDAFACWFVVRGDEVGDHLFPIAFCIFTYLISFCYFGELAEAYVLASVPLPLLICLALFKETKNKKKKGKKEEGVSYLYGRSVNHCFLP